MVLGGNSPTLCTPDFFFYCPEHDEEGGDDEQQGDGADKHAANDADAE